MSGRWILAKANLALVLDQELHSRSRKNQSAAHECLYVVWSRRLVLPGARLGGMWLTVLVHSLALVKSCELGSILLSK
jgi:hypothetical protein